MDERCTSSCRFVDVIHCEFASIDERFLSLLFAAIVGHPTDPDHLAGIFTAGALHVWPLFVQQ